MKEINDVKLQFTNPLVAVITGDINNFNIMPATSIGMISSDPMTFSLAIREGRKTSEYIDKYKSMVLSFPKPYLLSQIDFCGVISGNDIDKNTVVNLKIHSYSNFNIPIIENAALNILCTLENCTQLNGWNIYLISTSKVLIDDSFNGELVNFNPVTGDYIYNSHPIAKAGKASSYFKQKIEIANGIDYIDEVKQLFTEYTTMLSVDLSFQNYDDEFNDPTTKYGGSNGGIFIAKVDGKVIGCCAIHGYDSGRCELKRLYVKPKHRSNGIGRALVLKSIEKAIAMGYKQMILDTQTTLENSVRLYNSMRFIEIKPYYNNPYPNVIYYSLDL